MKPAVVRAVKRLQNPKGNPLEVARIAGIAAAKRTAEWIPLCHPLPLTHIDVTATLCQNGVELRSRVIATAQTGVEMEALVAVTAAALTVYDMCKALDKSHRDHRHRSGRKNWREERRFSRARAGTRASFKSRIRQSAIAMSAAARQKHHAAAGGRQSTCPRLVLKASKPFAKSVIADDGADALLKVIDEPPDVILCDYKMPASTAANSLKNCADATRPATFLSFMASRTDIEERLRPLVDGVEEFIVKPFLVKDLVRITKKVVDRLHLEKLQNLRHARA